jgi:hypothetical protein
MKSRNWRASWKVSQIAQNERSDFLCSRQKAEASSLSVDQNRVLRATARRTWYERNELLAFFGVR